MTLAQQESCWWKRVAFNMRKLAKKSLDDREGNGLCNQIWLLSIRDSLPSAVENLMNDRLQEYLYGRNTRDGFLYDGFSPRACERRARLAERFAKAALKDGEKCFQSCCRS